MFGWRYTDIEEKQQECRRKCSWAWRKSTIRKLIASCQNMSLLEKMFNDFLHKLGPGKVNRIIRQIEKMSGYKLT